jgi:hypothetical protein
MTIDEIGRDSAVALLEQTADGLDVEAHLHAVHAYAERREVRVRSRSRKVAAAIAFALVAVIVGVVAAVASISGDSSSRPTSPVRLKNAVGYEATTGMPRGFRATAFEKVDQALQSDTTSFRNVVFLEKSSRGRHVVAIFIMRNPFNGILADQSPAAAPRSTDPPSGLPSLSWTRAPYWELQVTGDIPAAQLARIAASVTAPDDAGASVDAVVVPKAPKRYRAVYHESATRGITRIRSLVYSRSYGARPSIAIATTDGGIALRRYAHMRLVRVGSREGILQRGRDGFGNVTYSLVFREGHERDTTVGSVGLSRRRFLDIAAHLRPVRDAGWAGAARGARTQFPDPDPSRSLRPGGAPGVTMASYSLPTGKYDAIFETFETDGVRWECLSLHAQDGSSNKACADPATGFAFPTLIGSASGPELVVGSIATRIATVAVTPDGKPPVEVSYYDTHTGSAPRIFLALVDPSDAHLRITATDSQGHVRQRVRVTAGPDLVLSVRGD